MDKNIRHPCLFTVSCNKFLKLANATRLDNLLFVKRDFKVTSNNLLGIFKSFNRDTRRKSWMKGRKFEEQLESDKIQPEVLKEVIKEVEEDEHQTSQ